MASIVAGRLGRGWPARSPTAIPRFVSTFDGLFVANLATQQTYGSMRGRTEPYADLDAIEQAFARLIAYCEARGIDRVATVRLGCGLGGLDWEAVAPRLERQSRQVRVEVYRPLDSEPALSR